jgi:ketosteroid isomerase-like protein
MVDLEKSVPKVLEAYTKAVLGKDVEAFIRLYDAKARVFDAWGVWSYEGSEAWQRAVEAWFSSLGTERVAVSFDETQVLVHGEFALVSTIATYAGLSAQGESLRSMQNRLTWAMRLKGHVLRIVHEHTSAPLGFEDMKAILQRTQASASIR